jgi:hypothetical protein
MPLYIRVPSLITPVHCITQTEEPEILEKHDIDPEPKPVISVNLNTRSYRNQAPPKPSYFVERPEVSIDLKKLLLSSETAETGTLVRYISFH